MLTQRSPWQSLGIPPVAAHRGSHCGLPVRPCRHDQPMTETMPNESFDWDAARAQLGKRADEGFPPAWQPEEPDEEILGVVARVTMQAPTAFGPSPVVELVLESGERLSVWLYHTVLRRSFE